MAYLYKRYVVIYSIRSLILFRHLYGTKPRGIPPSSQLDAVQKHKHKKGTVPSLSSVDPQTNTARHLAVQQTCGSWAEWALESFPLCPGLQGAVLVLEWNCCSEPSKPMRIDYEEEQSQRSFVTFTWQLLLTARHQKRTLGSGVQKVTLCSCPMAPMQSAKVSCLHLMGQPHHKSSAWSTNKLLLSIGHKLSSPHLEVQNQPIKQSCTSSHEYSQFSFPSNSGKLYH